MAAKSHEDGIEDPSLTVVDYGKQWRVGKRSDGKWADCEIILEINRNGEEKLTVVKDGIRIVPWTNKGFAVKPPRKKDGWS